MDRLTPRLVANWRFVIKRAWSMRLLYLAGILSGLEVFLPLAGADVMPFSKWCFALLTLVIVAAAFVARILAQQKRYGEMK